MSEIALGLKQPKARKEHICDWCGQIIEKGATYYKWAWVDEGCSVSTVKAHDLCYEWTTKIQDDNVGPVWFERSQDRVWHDRNQ